MSCRRGLIYLALFVVAWIPGRVQSENTVDLVILHVNDTHGKLYPRTTKDRQDVGGIGRLSTMVRSIREENPGRVLFLHAGDMFSRGAPETVHSGGLVNLRVFEAMGVDALTPGNGEFYFGIDNLERQTSRVITSFVHGNVTYRNSHASIFPPYVIKEVEGIRVGIIGLGLIRLWHHSSDRLTLHDPVAIAKRYAHEIRSRVDLLIALTHIGVKNDSLVAAAVPELDLIVGGDSHTRLDQPSRITRSNGQGSVAIVQANHYFNFLGRVDLRMEQAKGRYRVKKIDGGLLPIDGRIESDPEIDKMVSDYRASLDEVICHASTDLADAKSKVVGVGQLVADAVRHQARADIAIVGANSDTTGIAQGPIKLSDVVRIVQFHPELITARMSLNQIKTILTKRFYLTSGCDFTRTDSSLTDLKIGSVAPDAEDTFLVALTNQVAFRSRGDLGEISYDQTGQRVDTAFERYLRTAKVVP